MNSSVLIGARNVENDVVNMLKKTNKLRIAYTNQRSISHIVEINSKLWTPLRLFRLNKQNEIEEAESKFVWLWNVNRLLVRHTNTFGGPPITPFLLNLSPLTQTDKNTLEPYKKGFKLVQHVFECYFRVKIVKKIAFSCWVLCLCINAKEQTQQNNEKPNTSS